MYIYVHTVQLSYAYILCQNISGQRSPSRESLARDLHYIGLKLCRLRVMYTHGYVNSLRKTETIRLRVSDKKKNYNNLHNASYITRCVFRPKLVRPAYYTFIIVSITRFNEKKKN